MLALLFSANYDLLGELTFEEGRSTRISLSTQGDEVLQDTIKGWQTRGIPLRETFEYTEQQAGEEVRTVSTVERLVLLTSAEAEWAFFCWASDAGYIALKMPERLLVQWQKLSHIPLDPEERFASLQALLTAPHALLEAWEQGMDSVLQTTHG